VPVSSLGFLESFRVVNVDAQGRARVEVVVAEAWGIVHAHGGVVMAALLHAAELVLGREDLRMASATATFCRPVPCGPVVVDVEVLRNGKGAAQILARLHCVGDTDSSANAIAMVVFAAPTAGWPEHHGLQRPAGLVALPDAHAPRFGVDIEGRALMPFFHETDWRDVTPDDIGPLHRLAWFAFREPPLRADGSWVSAMLAVPGDALGLAAVPPVSAVMGPLTSPSLQISIEFATPARGTWIGIDSRCHHCEGAIASGVATLWSADGALVATVGQSALLRRMPGQAR
jgi:acyl-CoA thioesterase